MSSKRVVLPVKGMGCSSCAARVKESLLRLPGVLGVEVDLSPGSARVEYDSQAVSIEAMAVAVNHAGYEAGPAVGG